MGLNNSRSSACLIVESRVECLPADVLWRIFSSINSDVSKLHLELVNRYFQILARTYCWKYLKAIRISREHVNNLQIWERSAAICAIDHILPSVSQNRLKTIELKDSDLEFLDLTVKPFLKRGADFPHVRRVVVKNITVSTVDASVPEGIVHLISSFANSLTSLILDFTSRSKPTPELKNQYQRKMALFTVNIWNAILHCKNLKELRFFECPWLDPLRYHRIASALEGKRHLSIINLSVAQRKNPEDFTLMAKTAESLQSSMKAAGLADIVFTHFTSAELSALNLDVLMGSLECLILKTNPTEWSSRELSQKFPNLRLLICYDNINGLLFSSYLQLNQFASDNPAAFIIVAKQIDQGSLTHFDSLEGVRIRDQGSITAEEWKRIRRIGRHSEAYGIAERDYVNMSKIMYGNASVILITQGFQGGGDHEE